MLALPSSLPPSAGAATLAPPGAEQEARGDRWFRRLYIPAAGEPLDMFRAEFWPMWCPGGFVHMDMAYGVRRDDPPSFRAWLEYMQVREELANDKEKQKKSAQQQSLIEESGKIIEYLRKENMKLRTQNDTMRSARVMTLFASLSSIPEYDGREVTLGSERAEAAAHPETPSWELENFRNKIEKNNYHEHVIFPECWRGLK